MAISQKFIAMLEVCDQVCGYVTQQVCDDCEGVCYVASVHATGRVQDEFCKKYAGKVEHMSLDDAMRWVAGIYSAAAHRVQAAHQEEELRELQPSLW